MSRTNSIKVVIAAYAGASVLAACSQQAQDVSQLKTNIDHQKDSQMQMVDNKTDELKHNVETNKALALQNIDLQKKALATQSDALNDEKAKVKVSADYANKNLNDQAAACKTKIKSNVDAAKAQVDGGGKRLQGAVVLRTLAGKKSPSPSAIYRAPKQHSLKEAWNCSSGIVPPFLRQF